MNETSYSPLTFTTTSTDSSSKLSVEYQVSDKKRKMKLVSFRDLLPTVVGPKLLLLLEHLVPVSTIRYHNLYSETTTFGKSTVLINNDVVVDRPLLIMSTNTRTRFTYTKFGSTEDS